MAEEPTTEAQEESQETAEATKKSSKRSGWRRLLPGKWATIILTISAVNFVVGFTCARVLLVGPSSGSTAEVGLGPFEFKATEQSAGSIVAADFALHVALLDKVDRIARQRLQAQEHRVRQDVEQLLRQAHGGDFEDPKLAGLKRQIQEQVNETLRMRAISDVIITDLELTHAAPETPAQQETAQDDSWAKAPSKLASTTDEQP